MQGLPLRISKVSVADPRSLAQVRAAVIYVASGFSPAELLVVADVLGAAKALSVYRAPEYRGTLVLGVIREGASQRLVVDLAAAKAATVKFDAMFLQLALTK